VCWQEEKRAITVFFGVIGDCSFQKKAERSSHSALALILVNLFGRLSNQFFDELKLLAV